MANPFLDDYLKELEDQEIEKTSFGSEPFGGSSLFDTAEIPQEEKNFLWDVVGSTAWAFAEL